MKKLLTFVLISQSFQPTFGQVEGTTIYISRDSIINLEFNNLLNFLHLKDSIKPNILIEEDYDSSHLYFCPNFHEFISPRWIIIEKLNLEDAELLMNYIRNYNQSDKKIGNTIIKYSELTLYELVALRIKNLGGSVLNRSTSLPSQR